MTLDNILLGLNNVHILGSATAPDPFRGLAEGVGANLQGTALAGHCKGLRATPCGGFALDFTPLQEVGIFRGGGDLPPKWTKIPLRGERTHPPNT